MSSTVPIRQVTVEKYIRKMVPMALAAHDSRRAQVKSTVMDEADFQIFYQRIARPLRSYLLRCIRDASLADDLLQETFLRFLRSGFESDDNDYRRNYVFRIASNLVKDHYRRRKPDVELVVDPAEETNHQTSVEVQSDVAQAMADLAPRDRQMLWLAYVEGSSHQEIAQALGLRVSSLKSMLFRARKRLAGSLSALGLGPARKEA